MESYKCLKLSADAGFAPKDVKPNYQPDLPFRTKHVRLELNLDYGKRTLYGICETTLVRMDEKAKEAVFDATLLKISSVTEVHNKKLKFTYKDNKLTVSIPEGSTGKLFTVRIVYSTANPLCGIRFVRYDEKSGPSHQAWTQGQSDDTRFWFPCIDLTSEKATSEIIVTVPRGNVAISNGHLVARTQKNGKATYHWKMNKPNAIYLFTVASGNFSEVKDSWSGIPVTFYAPAGQEEDAKRGFRATKKVLQFFSEFTGVKYPWDKYAQIAAWDYWGGMENTSATTQTFAALVPENVVEEMDFDGLVAHEAAHQWFGDFLTCYDWSHAWLNESFATYFDALFQRHDKGDDEFYKEMLDNANAYLAEARSYKRPIVTQKWKYSMALFDRHLYPKGACVLHFLHELVGTQQFRAAIRQYLNKHQYGSVNTRDLIEAFRAAAGRNLERQFDQWIFREGHPEFQIAYEYNKQKKELRLWVAQRTNGAWELPVEIWAYDSRGTCEKFRFDISKQEHVVSIPLKSAPSSILFDPLYKVPCKRVTFVKDLAMLEKDLLNHPTSAGKIETVKAIAEVGKDTAVEVLERNLGKLKFWGVRAAIVDALAQIKTPAAKALLLKLADNDSPKVRRPAVRALGAFPGDDTIETLAAKFKKDTSIFVQADSLRSLAQLKYKNTEDLVKAALKTDSWMNTLRNAAIDAISVFTENPSRLKPFLKELGKPNVRAAALREICRLYKNDTRAIDLCKELLHKDPSEAVRKAALRLLGDTAHPNALPELKKILDGNEGAWYKNIADKSFRSIRMDMAGDLPKPEPAQPMTNGCAATNVAARKAKPILQRRVARASRT